MSQQIINHNSSTQFGTKKSAVIFNHVYKCAGTTISKILQEHFPCSFYDATFIKSWKQLGAFCESLDPHHSMAISGHSAWGMHELLPSDFLIYYITVLRHPVDRIISEYKFSRSRYSPIRTLTEFVKSSPNDFIVNRLGNGSLELSIERLSSTYYMFGTVERFNDFTSMLAAKLGFDISAIDQYNATAPENESINYEAIHYFMERNSKDLELYKWASLEFDKRWRSWNLSSSCNSGKELGKKISEKKIIINQYSASIRTLIDKRKNTKAAEQIEPIPNKTGPHCFYLAQNFELANNDEKAEEWYMKSVAIDPELMPGLVDFLLRIDPDRVPALLRNASKSFQNIKSTLADSHINSYRLMIMKNIVKASIAMGNIDKARKVISKACKITPTFLDEDMIESFIKATLNNLTRLSGKINLTTKIALFGAGAHTTWLEQIIGEATSCKIMAILDDHPDNLRTSWGIKPELAEAWDPMQADVIILSTDTLTDKFKKRCRKLYGSSIKILNIYQGLPAGPYKKRFNPAKEANHNSFNGILRIAPSGFWANRCKPQPSLYNAAAMFESMHGKQIVEIGSGIQGDMSGNSILVWANKTKARSIVSIDLDEKHINDARAATSMHSNVNVIHGDGIKYLKKRDEAIDLLYLDFSVPDNNGDLIGTARSNAYLKAYVNARKCMSPESMILIDDTDHTHPWKHTAIIPAAQNDGFTVMWTGRQTMLKR